LAVPGVLFYLFIGKVIFGLAFAAAAVAAIPFFRTGLDEHGPVAWRRVPVSLACALAAVLLTTLGGEGRLLPATADWIVRDAVLHDLVMRSWPFVYQIDGINWVLRAPLGMYLLPALIGKIGGLYAAYAALWLQNCLAIFTILRIFCASTSMARSITVLAVFCIFSGWDVVGASIISLCQMLLFHTPFAVLYDIGWWDRLFQYSSTITLAYWVPNHALAGWLFTALLLMWDRRQVGLYAVVMGAGLAALWSPFALMGALPFVIKALLEASWQRRVAWRAIAVPILLLLMLLPLLRYLTIGSTDVPHNPQPQTYGFYMRYALFIAIEVLPFVVINYLFGDGRGGFSTSTYVLAVASLLLIPFYRIGGGNDFVMRASIPALAILAVTTGHTAYRAVRISTPVRASIVALTLGLGFLTGLDQTRHVLERRNNGIGTSDLVQVWGAAPKAPYLAEQSQVPRLLRSDHPQIYVTAATGE
jgi:hypothetical protein